MLLIILGIVILAAIFVPIFWMTDSKYTHKKCKFCGKSVKVESATCRYCKAYLLEPESDEA